MSFSADREGARALFGAIAERYDRTNWLMSFGLHAGWNRALCRAICSAQPISLLDLCAGTGAIGLRLGQNAPHLKQITLVDFSPQMLRIAKRRCARLGKIAARVDFIEADVCRLPRACKRGAFDAVSIAYGIRNVSNPQALFHEAWQALRPGGILGILELTRPQNALLFRLHRLYLGLLPHLGYLATGHKEAYTHLIQSVGQFVDARKLTELAQRAHFVPLLVRPLSLGISTLLLFRKED